jgi:glycosyltransferase involved in cell wall biosynthesis
MYAIFVDSSNISGAEKRAIKLFHELNSSGITCTLIMSKRLFDLFSNGEYKQYLDGRNYIVAKTGWLDKIRSSKLLFFFGSYLGYNQTIEKMRRFQIKKEIESVNIKFSVLHVFLDLEIAFYLKSNLPNVGKVIFEITSQDFVEKISSHKASKLEKIDHFNAVSESTYIKALDHLSPSKIMCAPVPFFSPEYDIDQNEIWLKKENIIIFAHRLIPRKNGLLFAKVAKHFLKFNSNWKIKIFGKGPQAESINNLLKQEILSGQVLTGHRNDMLSELEKSKIFISLIEPDNYPSQSVLEAMYTGNALLLSNQGFTKEKFLAGNGLLCEISFEDIFLKLTQLVSDEKVLDSFGKKSLGILEARYNKEVYINYVHRMYKLIG